MKNRKLVLGVFLILAVLFLGIGYAALTNSLSMEGTINSSADDNNLVVEFDREYTPYSEVAANRIAISSTRKSPKEVTINVSGFTTEGDTAVIYFKIINNSNQIDSYDALLSAFEVTMKHGEEDAEGTASANKFEGKHFTVNVEYVDSYYDKEAAQNVSASSVAYEDGQPILKANGHEYVFVKVTITVNPVGITENLDAHHFTIKFNANTMSSEE